jgi:predicted metal-dependent hydrolase
MAYKQFILAEGQPVTIYKRRKARSLKLSISPKGQIKVSIPTWAPYKAGLDFAYAHQEWIAAQQPHLSALEPNQAIGKAHHLSFIAEPNRAEVAMRLTANEIVIRYPSQLSYRDPVVQAKAEAAAIKALRLQAKSLLPQRLSVLAAKHDFKYKSVSVRQLRGRWGSCDQSGNIVLNLYLMQMPWELIDYVLLHELTHTQVLRHGPQFWQTMERFLPEVKAYKNQLKGYQPLVNSLPTSSVA